MKGDFEDPDHSAYSRDTRLLIRSMLKQMPEARPNVNKILGAPVMQRPIASLTAKYPELQLYTDTHEDLDETVLPINVLPEEPSVMLGDVVQTFQNLSVSSKGSAASTVKYSVEDAYSADFEAYSTDSEASTYREQDSIDDLSNPAGIFAYVCNRVGETRATLLFAMIQRRVDAAPEDAEVASFRDEALQLLPDASSEELDHVLSLAEAAVFLQNAYNLSLLT